MARPRFTSQQFQPFTPFRQRLGGEDHLERGNLYFIFFVLLSANTLTLAHSLTHSLPHRQRNHFFASHCISGVVAWHQDRHRFLSIQRACRVVFDRQHTSREKRHQNSQASPLGGFLHVWYIILSLKKSNNIKTKQFDIFYVRCILSCFQTGIKHPLCKSLPSFCFVKTDK